MDIWTLFHAINKYLNKVIALSFTIYGNNVNDSMLDDDNVKNSKLP